MYILIGHAPLVLLRLPIKYNILWHFGLKKIRKEHTGYYTFSCFFSLCKSWTWSEVALKHFRSATIAVGILWKYLYFCLFLWAIKSAFCWKLMEDNVNFPSHWEGGAVLPCWGISASLRKCPTWASSGSMESSVCLACPVGKPLKTVHMRDQERV